MSRGVPRRSLVLDLARRAADARGVYADDVMRPCRFAGAVAARRDVWVALRARGHSLAAIAHHWGAHHTTVMFGLAVHTDPIPLEIQEIAR